MATAAAPSPSGISQGAVPSSRRPDGTLRKEIKVRPGFIPQEDIPRFRSPRVLEKLNRASPTSSPASVSLDHTLSASLGALNLSTPETPMKRGSSSSMHAPSSNPSSDGLSIKKSGSATSAHVPKKTGSAASIYAPQPSSNSSKSISVAQDPPASQPEKTSTPTQPPAPTVSIPDSPPRKSWPIGPNAPSPLAMDTHVPSLDSQPPAPPPTAYRSTRLLNGKTERKERDVEGDWNAAKHCFAEGEAGEEDGKKGKKASGKKGKKGKGKGKKASVAAAIAVPLPVGEESFTEAPAPMLSPSLSQTLPPSLSKLDPSKAPFTPSRSSSPIPLSRSVSQASTTRVGSTPGRKRNKGKNRAEDERALFDPPLIMKPTHAPSPLAAKPATDEIVVNLPRGRPVEQIQKPKLAPRFSDDSWGVHLRTQSWADEIDLDEDEPSFS